jgi:hypothetical protein
MYKMTTKTMKPTKQIELNNPRAKTHVSYILGMENAQTERE